MPYTLYYSPDSANIIIRTALEELGVPYNATFVDRAASQHRESAYLSLNPQGLLPVLTTPEQDEPLFETGAILIYLADRHAGLLPTDPRARGRCLKWLFFLSNTVHAELRTRFYTDRYVDDAAAIPSLRSGLAARFEGHLEILDREIARHGQMWLTGETMTICDIYLGPLIRWAQLYPTGDAIAPSTITALPHLRALLENLAARPAVARAFAAENLTGHPFIDPIPGFR